MLHIMRNTTLFGNNLLMRAVRTVGDRLPEGWLVTRAVREPRGIAYRPDALVEVRGPDGAKAVIVVEAKRSVTAAEAIALVPRLEAAVLENKARVSMVVANYLSPLARERLAAAGVSYLDSTGNVRISLDRPALFIEARGADRDPSPQRTGPRSLKGASAARIVRALCDWKPPVGVRELARRAGTDPGYASRILNLLEREDVITRDRERTVTAVKWKDLLRRWAQDYAVARTNRAYACLEPRGLDALLGRLRNYPRKWALTGSRAVPPGAATAQTRVISCYIESPERAAADLGLRNVESGSNVLLLEPFDSVAWERTREQDGLTCVALSQCAVDLLTGTGREPSEAEALFLWMERNENAWRT